MRMIESSLYPVIPYLHVQQHDREVTSMSDFVHTGRGPKMALESRMIESRLLFVACYLLLSLPRAVVMRLMPWRKQNVASQPRQSIFKEASSAASAMVASSFVGL